MKLDNTQLLELLDHDQVAMKSVMSAYLDSATTIVDKLNQHQSHEQRQGIVDCAHKLKSAAASIGAKELARLCNNLEFSAMSAKSEDLNMLMGRVTASSDAVMQLIRQEFGIC